VRVRWKDYYQYPFPSPAQQILLKQTTQKMLDALKLLLCKKGNRMKRITTTGWLLSLLTSAVQSKL
jgi:hypothetical protein